MSDETDGSDGETCPVCGQPYAHKREIRPDVGTIDLRADAVACKTSKIGRTRTMYVHLTRQPAVSRVVAKRDDDDSTPFLGGVLQ